MGRITPDEQPEVYIVESILGLFAFDSDNNLIDKILYPLQPEAIAERIMKLEAGKTTSELQELLQRLSEIGFSTFVFENRALSRSIEEELQLPTAFRESTAPGDIFRQRLGEIISEFCPMRTIQEFYMLAHEVTEIITKERLSKEFEGLDPLIVQAVHVIEELDKGTNVLSTKTREWYSVQFPELNRLVDNHETYMKMVSEIGGPRDFTAESLERINVQAPLSERVVTAAGKSIGAHLEGRDLEIVRALAGGIIGLFDLRKSLENYVASLTEVLAPNMVAVIGPMLTAKLISKSGGLAKLASMPSSRIQVLGAEKAMFRALRTGARPPKHGLIFQHPLVHSAPKEQRGKVARLLAAKLSVAARADVYSKRFIGRNLREELEKRIRHLS